MPHILFSGQNTSPTNEGKRTGLADTRRMKPADDVPMLLLSATSTGFNPIINQEHPMPVILPEVVAVSRPAKGIVRDPNGCRLQ